MTPAEQYAYFERTVAEALCAADPVEHLVRRAHAPAVPATLQRALTSASPAGVREAARQIAIRRRSRLLEGSGAARQIDARDPAAFDRLFVDYHRAVPPTAFFPLDEAALFLRWRGAKASARTGSATPTLV